MKAHELAEILMDYPDFDINFTLFEPDGSVYGMGCRTFKIDGISDIGHSSKIISLDGEDNEYI